MSNELLIDLVAEIGYDAGFEVCLSFQISRRIVGRDPDQAFTEDVSMAAFSMAATCSGRLAVSSWKTCLQFRT